MPMSPLLTESTLTGPFALSVRSHRHDPFPHTQSSQLPGGSRIDVWIRRRDPELSLSARLFGRWLKRRLIRGFGQEFIFAATMKWGSLWAERLHRQSSPVPTKTGRSSGTSQPNFRFGPLLGKEGGNSRIWGGIHYSMETRVVRDCQGFKLKSDRFNLTPEGLSTVFATMASAMRNWVVNRTLSAASPPIS
jgi:hypothetical protein